MTRTLIPHQSHRLTEWTRSIPDDEWQVYQDVIDAASARSIPFAVGGAFSVATLTGRWRNTKDLDLYVLPEHRDKMIELMNHLGFTDYYETKPYDRWWIHRTTRNDAIVDIIWALANHRAQIDELWMSGPEVEIRGRSVRVLPAEAMVWDKLYILQRDRCDWPDVMNLLYAAGTSIDWEYLLDRMGDDSALMSGVLSIFRWVSPGAAEKLPSWIWPRLGLPPIATGAGPVIEKRRVDLLDTRPWYGPERDKLQAA